MISPPRCAAARIDGVERRGGARVDHARGPGREMVCREHGDPTIDAEPARLGVRTAHTELLGLHGDELRDDARAATQQLGEPSSHAVARDVRDDRTR